MLYGSVPKSFPWYDNAPIGKNTIGDKMKTLSKKSGLSKVYTNHCLRATCVTTLDSVGFEARHIMGVSGHKAETSIRNYSRVDEAKKREMSLALSSKMIPDFTSAGPATEPTFDLMNPDMLSLSQTEEILKNMSPIDQGQLLNIQPSESVQKTSSSAMYTIQNLQNCTVNIYQNKC